MLKKINNIRYYLNFSCPVRIDKKNFLISIAYEFALIFVLLISIKPMFFSELKLYSLLEASFTTSFLVVLFGAIYFYRIARKIDLKTWTYRKDIINYIKFISVFTVVFILYFFKGIRYMYKNEISSAINYLSILQMIGYILFTSVLVYIVLRLINHLNVFFKDSINYSLSSELDEDINVIISDVSEYVKEINSPEIIFTKREKEILNLIYDGYTSAQIAEKLFISITTVNTHRQNLIKKNNVKNTTSLLKLLKKEY